jgi:hypothetical protein
MTSRTLTRTGRCLAIAGLLMGTALTASPAASGEPVLTRINDCIAKGNTFKDCCAWTGGTFTDTDKGGFCVHPEGTQLSPDQLNPTPLPTKPGGPRPQGTPPPRQG